MCTPATLLWFSHFKYFLLKLVGHLKGRECSPRQRRVGPQALQLSVSHRYCLIRRARNSLLSLQSVPYPPLLCTLQNLHSQNQPIFARRDFSARTHHPCSKHPAQPLQPAGSAPWLFVREYRWELSFAIRRVTGPPSPAHSLALVEHVDEKAAARSKTKRKIRGSSTLLPATAIEKRAATGIPEIGWNDVTVERHHAGG